MSGPVAGAVGAAELCRQLGIQQGVTADVGGTTFDASLILNGQPLVKYEGRVAGMPLQTTWVDVRSIGAGGGSIAFEDAGLLHVGPRSAGASPGPVCYGRGGTEPTVTDAAATLGMLAFGELAGGVRLDQAAAYAAIERLGDALGLDVDRTAQGVIQITAVAMANAIRAILEEVGEDPRQAALIAFGGAGPLFGTLIARELNIRTIVVPNYAGNFSAWGLLLQDLSRSAARTVVTRFGKDGLEVAARVLTELEADLQARIAATPTSVLSTTVLAASLDLRYEGQEYFLTVEADFRDGRLVVEPDELQRSFERDYERRYGHTLHSPIEIVAARLTAVTPLPKTNLLAAPPRTRGNETRRSIDAFSFTAGRRMPFEVVERTALTPDTVESGPMIVLEDTATTYVDAGYEVAVDRSGVLLLTESEVS
jgi:N-methylhydantoinase A